MSSSLERRLQLDILEINGISPSIWLRFRILLDELCDVFYRKIKYYEIKHFIKNLPHFIKQAWYWRDFDESYSIECFAQNLEKLADGLKRWNNCVNSTRNSRRCKYGAHLLRQAYEGMHCINDVSYINWSKNNEVYFDKIEEGVDKGLYQMKHRRKYSEDYSNKMWKVIHKRTSKVEADRKKEAWEYIHKYIECWWD